MVGGAEIRAHHVVLSLAVFVLIVLIHTHLAVSKALINADIPIEDMAEVDESDLRQGGGEAELHLATGAHLINIEHRSDQRADLQVTISIGSQTLLNRTVDLMQPSGHYGSVDYRDRTRHTLGTFELETSDTILIKISVNELAGTLADRMDDGIVLWSERPVDHRNAEVIPEPLMWTRILMEPLLLLLLTALIPGAAFSIRRILGGLSPVADQGEALSTAVPDPITKPLSIEVRWRYSIPAVIWSVMLTAVTSILVLLLVFESWTGWLELASVTILIFLVASIIFRSSGEWRTDPDCRSVIVTRRIGSRSIGPARDLGNISKVLLRSHEVNDFGLYRVMIYGRRRFNCLTTRQKAVAEEVARGLSLILNCPLEREKIPGPYRFHLELAMPDLFLTWLQVAEVEIKHGVRGVGLVSSGT